MTETPLLSAMNCSLRMPMTFSMEVEPLVDTLPDRAAGVSVPVVESVLSAAGASVLEPQPVRAAMLRASVKSNASVFFMLFFLFSDIQDSLLGTLISVAVPCKMKKTDYVKSMSNQGPLRGSSCKSAAVRYNGIQL